MYKGWWQEIRCKSHKMCLCSKCIDKCYKNGTACKWEVVKGGKCKPPEKLVVACKHFKEMAYKQNNER